MRYRGRGLATFAVLLVTVSLSVSVVAQERPLSTVPFDTALSIYVGHNGTWLNYNSGLEEAAEIEDPVAAFQSWETISDEPYVWRDHQINLPPIPDGWLFFDAVETEPMELYVIVRDTDTRLGAVDITYRDTGALIGTLEANAQGSEIAGSVLVEPVAEAFNLEVTDNASGITILKAGSHNARIVDAVAFKKGYGWVPRCGDEHTPCPAGVLPGPFGNPESIEGKESTYPEQGDLAACLGPTEFDNDSRQPGAVPPRYVAKTKQLVGPPVGPPGGLGPEAEQEVEQTIAEAKQPFTGGDDLDWLNVKPYSRGTGHWLTTLTGGYKAVIYFPYRARETYKTRYKLGVEGRLTPSWPEGLGKQDAAAAVVGSVNWGPDDEKQYQCLPPQEVGNVWGLTLTPQGTPFPSAQPEENITTPVTFELWADKTEPDGNPGYIGGTGEVTRDEAWTTPAPPPPLFSPLTLTFPDGDPDKGRCTVELGKGWKWKATGQPEGAGYYSQGEFGPFQVAPPGPQRINVELQVLFTLIVKTIDPQGEPCEAEIELYQQDGPNWLLKATGWTSPSNGDQVWQYPGAVDPGTYKVRARATAPWEPPWTEKVFPVVADITHTETLTVDPGEAPPGFP